MPQEWPQILTPDQVSNYLQMEIDEVIALLSSRQMPGNQVAGKWRIRKSTLDEWIDNPTVQGNTATPLPITHRDGRSGRQITSGDLPTTPPPVTPIKTEDRITGVSSENDTRIKGILTRFPLTDRNGSIYGFITAQDGGSIYVNTSDVENNGQSLSEGDGVEFEILQRGAGYVAKKVKLLSEKTGTAVSVTPDPEKFSKPSHQQQQSPPKKNSEFICSKGHKNPAENRFCTQCGEALRSSPIVPSDNLSQPQPSESIKGTITRFPLKHQKFDYIYGFITAEDGRSVYVKASDIENNRQSLKEGDPVEFEIVSVAQGWAANKVTLLSQQTVRNPSIALPRKAVKVEPVSVYSGRIEREPCAAVSQMPTRITGVVKTYNSSTGFGFITAEDGRDVYVNVRDVDTWGQSLSRKDSVEFEIVSVPRGTGWAAKEVTILSAQTDTTIISSPPDKPGYRQPTYPEGGLLYKEALAARDQGNFDRARKLFEEAIRSEPHQTTFLAYAATEKNLNKIPKALQIYKKGIEALPEDGILYEHYAMLLRQRDKLADAADILRKGLRAAPHFARQLHWALARVLVEMEDDVSFKEAAAHVEEAKKLGMTKATMPTLEFVTGYPLGRNTWDFFKSADFEIRVEKCTKEYAEILVKTRQPEYTESYNLNGWILAKCFFKNVKEKDIENLLQTLRDPSENYRNQNLNNDICFLILKDATQWQDNLRRTKEDGREVIIPIDKNVFAESEEITGILRQELDKWLSGRDLFQVRYPVSGLRFYGRDAELQDLMRNIDDGQHTGIYGLRKVGKTSLMLKLPEKRPLDLVVYVDLQEISLVNDCAYLYWAIARKLQEQLDLRKKELGLALKDVKLELGSESDYSKLDKPEEKNALRFDGDIRRLLEVLATNETTASSKIVITIDELEYMLPIGVHKGFTGYDRFFAYLRGISQSTHGRVVSVIAAANPAISEKPRWDGRDNPVFQFYKEMFLPPLEKEECNDMIAKIGRGMSVSFDKDSLEAVYSETGGHPYITRQLCSHIIAQDKSRPFQVNRRLVSENINTFIRDKRAIFEEILERLKNSFPEELDLLLAIAQGSSKEAELAHLITVPIDVALRHLIGYQIVDYKEGEYKIKINLLQRWLEYSSFR